MTRTVRSMTGFGSGTAELDHGRRVTAEVRSVNGRFLDERFSGTWNTRRGELREWIASKNTARVMATV